MRINKPIFLSTLLIALILGPVLMARAEISQVFQPSPNLTPNLNLGPVVSVVNQVPQCGTCPATGHPYQASWIAACPPINNDMNGNRIPDFEFVGGDCNNKIPCDRDLDNDSIPDAQPADTCVCSACTVMRDVDASRPGYFGDTPAGAAAKRDSSWCQARNVSDAGRCISGISPQTTPDCFVTTGVPDPIECGEAGNLPADGQFSCSCLDEEGDKVCQKEISGIVGGVRERYGYIFDATPEAYLGLPKVKDNCPAVPNQNQMDSDRDGVGDACDSELIRPADPFGPCPYCGDGLVDPDREQCDDGNTFNNDSCVGSCQNARCGDGYLHTGVEACDDGNAVDTDGCTNRCSLPTCGDRIVQAGEQCDDGNADNTDACLTTCRNATCGDGFIRAGSEQCDGGAGCSGCLLITPTPPPQCASPADCNDGLLCTQDICEPATRTCQHPALNCDDGIACTQDSCYPGTGTCMHGPVNSLCNDGDACNGIETCNPASGCRAGTPLQCNDGNACNGVETCVGGNCAAGTPIVCPDDGDRCNGAESCDAATGSCGHVNPVVCADDRNLCNGREVCYGPVGCISMDPVNCDDGIACTDDSCTAATGACVHDGANCPMPLPESDCGNGILEGKEGCDDGNNADGDGCNFSCVTEEKPVCGNGKLEAGETCDGMEPPPEKAGLVCKADCSGWSEPSCGNGIPGEVNPATGKSEVCDPPGSAYRVGEETCTCDTGCTGYTCTVAAPAPACGNGVVDKGEECDPKDPKTGEGCDPATCTVKKVTGETPPPAVAPVDKCAESEKKMDEFCLSGKTKEELGVADVWTACIDAAKANCACTGVETVFCKPPSTATRCDEITDASVRACCQRFGERISVEAVAACGCAGFPESILGDRTVGGGTITGPLNICCQVNNYINATVTPGAVLNCVIGVTPVSPPPDPCAAWFEAVGKMLPECLSKCQANPADPDCGAAVSPAAAIVKNTAICEAANPARDTAPDGKIWAITPDGQPTPLRISVREASPEGILSLKAAHTLSLIQVSGEQALVSGMPGDESAGKSLQAPKLLAQIVEPAGDSSMTVLAPKAALISQQKEQVLSFKWEGRDLAGRLISESDTFSCPPLTIGVQGGGCKGCVIGPSTSPAEIPGNLLVQLLVLALPFFFRRRSLFLMALLIPLFFSTPLLARPGDPDTSFDGDGLVSTPVLDGDDFTSASAIQPDGKIVVVGTSDADPAPDRLNYNFSLVRYNPDGSLDASFGPSGNGKVTTDFGWGNDTATSIALQPDGKIVVGGGAFNGSNQDFAVVRYLPNGVLDPSFDGDGKVITRIGERDDLAYDLVIQSDGKIVLAGSSHNGTNNDFAVVRYNSDGSLDALFGPDRSGKVTLNFGPGNDTAQSLVIERVGGEDKIVVAGRSTVDGADQYAVARFNPNGTLDAGFDGDGRVLTQFGAGRDWAMDLTIQVDGKILVVGMSDTNPDPARMEPVFSLARYHPDGNLDRGFDGDGKVMTPMGTGRMGLALAVGLMNGGEKILVAGQTATIGGASSLEGSIARYEGNGSLDLTFGFNGIFITSVGMGGETGGDLTIQEDGKKIVVTGVALSGSNYDFALGRYWLVDAEPPAPPPANCKTAADCDDNNSCTEDGCYIAPGEASGVCQHDRTLDCVPEAPKEVGVVCVPSKEVCDGVDNDCNGIIDDGCPVPGPAGEVKPLCGNGRLDGKSCDGKFMDPGDICEGKFEPGEACDPPGATIDCMTCTDKCLWDDSKCPAKAAAPAEGTKDCSSANLKMQEFCFSGKTREELGVADVWTACIDAAKANCACTGVETVFCKAPSTAPRCDGITDVSVRACCQGFGERISVEAIAACGCAGFPESILGDRTVGGRTITGPVNICCQVNNYINATVTSGAVMNCVIGEAPGSAPLDPCAAWFKAVGKMPSACLSKCEANPASPECAVSSGPVIEPSGGALAKGTCRVEAVNKEDVAREGEIPVFYSLSKQGGCVPVRLTYVAPAPEGVLSAKSAAVISFTEIQGPDISTPKRLSSVSGSAEPSTTICVLPTHETQEVTVRAESLDLAGNPLAVADCRFVSTIGLQGGGGCGGCALGAFSRPEEFLANLLIALFIILPPFLLLTPSRRSCKF